MPTRKGRAVLAHVAGLVATQGQGVGLPFEVLPWERRFLLRAFDVDGDAALSVGRGNGKTTLAAAIADAVLRGPAPAANDGAASAWETRMLWALLGAGGRKLVDQARLTFDHVLAFGDYRDRSRWLDQRHG